MSEDDHEGSYTQPGASPALTAEGLARAVRVGASILGLILIIIGLLYALRIFGGVYDAIRDPAGISGLITRWAEEFGGDELTVELREKQLPLARALGIAVLGVGAIILAWLALGVMLAGAKIISWTTGDREAVKSVLRSAFGSRMRPPAAPRAEAKEEPAAGEDRPAGEERTG